jgi:hypothetical protein
LVFVLVHVFAFSLTPKIGVGVFVFARSPNQQPTFCFFGVFVFVVTTAF